MNVWKNEWMEDMVQYDMAGFCGGKGGKRMKSKGKSQYSGHADLLIQGSLNQISHKTYGM